MAMGRTRVTASDSGLIPRLPGPGKAGFLTRACCKVVGGTGMEEQAGPRKKPSGCRRPTQWPHCLAMLGGGEVLQLMTGLGLC